MKRSKFSEEQIVYAIRQADAATFYAWKKKYAHLGVREMRSLHLLEEENSRLKRLGADLSLDKHMVSEALGKNLRPARRRELAAWFHGTFQVTCLRACLVTSWGRSLNIKTQRSSRRWRATLHRLQRMRIGIGRVI